MAELEDKLNAILSDPNMMQLKKITALTSQGSIDRNQQTLLKALHPYLSQERIRKLEKAMRAAQMAKVATGVINSGVLQASLGR